MKRNSTFPYVYINSWNYDMSIKIPLNLNIEKTECKKLSTKINGTTWKDFKFIMKELLKDNSVNNCIIIDTMSSRL